MKQMILSVLYATRILPKQTMDRWESVSNEAVRGREDTEYRNRRDIPLLLKSGLDMETINATLFDARQRGDG